MITRDVNAAAPRWLETLTETVLQKPIVVLRFSEDEWAGLNESRGGTHTFTIARSYSSLHNVRVPTVCLLLGQEFGIGAPQVIHCGVLESRRSNTTLESRLKSPARVLSLRLPSRN